MGNKAQPLNGWKLADLNKAEVADRFEAVEDKAYSLVPYHFYQNNVSASQTSVAMELIASNSNVGYLAKGNGTIVKMMIGFDGGTAGGTATFTPKYNGVAITASAKAMVAGSQNGSQDLSIAVTEFGLIACNITTAAGFSSTTRDVIVTLYVKYDN